MNTNRNNTTVICNHIGQSMTPRISNIELARAHREAQYRANRRARRHAHAKREAQNKNNDFWRIIALIAVAILLVAFGFRWGAREAHIHQHMSDGQAYYETTVQLSNGHRVDREDYERANMEAVQEEMERLGLEG